MTQKKKKTTRKARKPYTPPAVAPAPAAEPVKPDAPKKITEFLWHGLTRYRCALCGFDAGTEVEAYSHYHKAHVLSIPGPIAVNEVDTGLVSPQGEKIVRIEEAENGED